MCSSISPLLANDLRLWTSRKGTSISAKLLKLEEDKAHLVTGEPVEASATPSLGVPVERDERLLRSR